MVNTWTNFHLDFSIDISPYMYQMLLKTLRKLWFDGGNDIHGMSSNNKFNFLM